MHSPRISVPRVNRNGDVAAPAPEVAARRKPWRVIFRVLLLLATAVSLYFLFPSLVDLFTQWHSLADLEPQWIYVLTAACLVTVIGMTYNSRMRATSPGDLLREARLRHGLSQEALAIRAGD